MTNISNIGWKVLKRPGALGWPGPCDHESCHQKHKKNVGEGLETNSVIVFPFNSHCVLLMTTITTLYSHILFPDEQTLYAWGLLYFTQRPLKSYHFGNEISITSIDTSQTAGCAALLPGGVVFAAVPDWV